MSSGLRHLPLSLASANEMLQHCLRWFILELDRHFFSDFYRGSQEEGFLPCGNGESRAIFSIVPLADCLS